MNNNTIYTIGHSTRPIDVFIDILKQFQIKILVDVRSFPGSRKYPQFNKELLSVILQKNNIRYIHLKELGGRRKALINSVNTSWHNPSFRGYADYMQTDQFKIGINELINIANKENTCIMCSEALWWRCHRSMIADYLKSIDRKVMHILSLHKEEEHRYTQPAKIVEGKLKYGQEPDLFNSI